MNYKNNDHFLGYPVPLLVLFIIGITIINYTSTSIDTQATIQPLDVNTTSTNNTITINPSSEIASMNEAFGQQPFYELNNSKDTGNEVVNLDPQQTKDSYIAQGYMQGVGNVTEYGTYITTYSSPISSSVGKGMIVKGDHVATFTAEDIGSYDSEGNLLLRGAMFFESADEEMASINGKVGLYIYWKGVNGTDWTKTWLWE